jgi:hypothetical protein
LSKGGSLVLKLGRHEAFAVFPNTLTSTADRVIKPSASHASDTANARSNPASARNKRTRNITSPRSYRAKEPTLRNRQWLRTCRFGLGNTLLATEVRNNFFANCPVNV